MCMFQSTSRRKGIAPLDAVAYQRGQIFARDPQACRNDRSHKRLETEHQASGTDLWGVYLAKCDRLAVHTPIRTPAIRLRHPKGTVRQDVPQVCRYGEEDCSVRPPGTDFKAAK
jgi:hypothetical protein